LVGRFQLSSLVQLLEWAINKIINQKIYNHRDKAKIDHKAKLLDHKTNQTINKNVLLNSTLLNRKHNYKMVLHGPPPKYVNRKEDSQSGKAQKQEAQIIKT
jgi:hypothetical protein